MTRHITISLDKKLSERMGKFVVKKSSSESNTLTVYLTPYQYDKYYISIERGTRSYVFYRMIDIFLVVLEKNGVAGSIFNSKGELIRGAITYNKILNKDNKLIIPTDSIPNGKNVRGKIPIGNKYYPDGEWKKYHGEKEKLRLSLLVKIHEKTNKFFTKQEIVNNFEIFYKAYKDELLETINLESTIRKLKLAIEVGSFIYDNLY